MQQLECAEPPATLASPAPEAALTSLKAEYNRMFTSGEYSDLTVKLRDGKVMRVHKVVVCRGANFFRYAVSKLPEGGEPCIIEMISDHPSAVIAMLQFLYIGDYGNIKDTDESQQALHHLQTYLISDKYNLHSLQSIAEERFEKALGNEHLDLIRVLPGAVEIAYHKDSNAHIWARALLTTKCAENLQALTETDDFPVLMGRFNTFAFDVAKAAAQQQQKSQAEALKKSEDSLENTRALLQKSEMVRRLLEHSLSATKASLQKTTDKLKRRDADLVRVQGELATAQSQVVPSPQNTVFRCPNINCHSHHVPYDFEEELECGKCKRIYEVWKWFLY